ncbi:very long-chain acyl-CoA synthetase-like isoform X1 [Trematomus bernacchii]|uniref:very long-chain acyl-CoA synthetase-like isoform X1 n=1 Tax=Trematomus bernacchii TaxID=40690 RepID=UPI00146A0AB1|nr:very long-chain acyl-CoA synthetase-like isoform X1 [Trematomus bernacchii]
MLVWIVFAAVGLLALFFRNPHFFRDVQFVRKKLKTRSRILKYMQTNYSILDRFIDAEKEHPHKPFILFGDETFTYRDAEELSNKAARVFLQSGLLKQGDTVALFLGNEPVFLWLWLGLVKIGCSAAFLNCNIRSKSLLHCFKCSGARTLVAAEELQDAVDEVLPALLEQQVTVFILTDRCQTADVKSFKDQMSQASSEPLSKDLRSHLTLRSPAAYIYTSGTTGFPKAAVISHAKLWQVACIPSLAGMNSDDVLYISLPLYHTAGFLGFASAIDRGITVALRSKFSVSQFWNDCRKYDVTVIQYIGEIMRYLCNTPKKPNDRSHKVRLAVGNGIRADVWRDFISRFGNVKIREFYGATEGNFGLINYSGKIGAVGRDSFLHRVNSQVSFHIMRLKLLINEQCFGFTFLSFILQRYFPHAVIRFDVETETPLRDSSGLCIEAAKGEPGLLVSEISLMAPFSGYMGDLQQSEKKRLHDVLRKGDLYFNTGDLLRIEEDNFIYFQDRVGDTFRWKGENVATTEVADVITMVDCIKEANVYGVEVPGHEGRAGMAAINLTEGLRFDSAAVFKHVENFLPAYARPRFLRIQSSLDVTGTFKHLKMKLVAEGFNPNQITDPLYFLDEKDKSYVPLTVDKFNLITSGQIKM